MKYINYLILLALFAFISCSEKDDDDLEFTPMTPPMPYVTVDASTSYQKVTGFGGMNNWEGTLTTAEVDKMFGKAESQLGYNILRIRISPYGQNDWQKAVTSVKQAKKYGAIILATPWTPPIAMKEGYKDASKKDIGGHLKTEEYANYAAYLRSFADYMKSQDAEIDVISIQNEPDIEVSYESCEWTPSQLCLFTKENAPQIGTKVLASESYKFDRAYTNPILNDETATANIQYVGGHIYGSGLSSYSLAEQKGKEIWMTEHLLNDAWNTNPRTTKIDETMAFAKEINDCMSAGFHAYIWWYLKRYYSMIGEGEQGTTNGAILQRGYILSHFAKYVTGKTRVGAGITGSSALELSITAYSSNSELVVMIVNSSRNHINQLGFKMSSEVKTGKAIVTTESKNMEVTTISSNEEMFYASIEPYSITTVIFKL